MIFAGRHVDEIRKKKNKYSKIKIMYAKRKKKCVTCFHRKFQIKCARRNKILKNIKVFEALHFWWTSGNFSICPCNNKALETCRYFFRKCSLIVLYCTKCGLAPNISQYHSALLNSKIL